MDLYIRLGYILNWSLSAYKKTLNRRPNLEVFLTLSEIIFYSKVLAYSICRVAARSKSKYLISLYVQSEFVVMEATNHEPSYAHSTVDGQR